MLRVEYPPQLFSKTGPPRKKVDWELEAPQGRDLARRSLRKLGRGPSSISATPSLHYCPFQLIEHLGEGLFPSGCLRFGLSSFLLQPCIKGPESRSLLKSCSGALLDRLQPTSIAWIRRKMQIVPLLRKPPGAKASTQPVFQVSRSPNRPVYTCLQRRLRS